MTTNQRDDLLEKLIEKQINMLGGRLSKDLEKQTKKLVNDLGDALSDNLGGYLSDILGSGTNAKDTRVAPGGGTSSLGFGSIASIQQITNFAVGTALSLFERGPRISTNTRESSRSVNEQEKFRTSRSQNMRDISQQLSIGNKNS